MYHIRETKTASGAVAIQVVRYIDRKLKVIKHIGSAHTDEEAQTLRRIATDWIKHTTKQQSLFAESHQSSYKGLTLLDKCEYIGVRYTFVYEVLSQLLERFEFTTVGNRLLCDLVIMRIIEPASKLQSLKLLNAYFGIHHRRQAFYEALPRLVALKEAAEDLAVKRAVAELAFDFSLVFYDVTTLYFESFEPDDLRKHGFSKDNKPQQPQIIIGLMVNREGFPIAYELFAGNKFEGHTLIPIIEAFKARHQIAALTVVADAAMLSMENVTRLRARGLYYIVGARPGNIAPKLLNEISAALHGQDGAAIRVPTVHGDLVCDFSQKRYRKDAREMERQIQKAEGLVNNPGTVKRAKFLKAGAKTRYELNTELIEKTKRLLGIKGYYTNLGPKVSNQTIVDRYHSLWHVERAFRIAKNDLEMRPIFHFKEQAIKVHMLICFMALAVSTYMEIKTGSSLRQIITAFKQVSDAQMLNTITNQKITMRTKIPANVQMLLQKLCLPY